MVVGEPLATHCYEMTNDEHPKEIGEINSAECHTVMWACNCLWSIGPQMFTAGNFDMMKKYSLVSNEENLKCNLLDTNLQLMTIIKSKNIFALIGVYYEKEKKRKDPVHPEEISVIPFLEKNGFKMNKKTYNRKHTQKILTMVSYSEEKKLLTFSMDYHMKTWIIHETRSGRRKMGELKCIDDWYIRDMIITCAKVTTGGKYVIAGTFIGAILILNPKTKHVLGAWSLKYKIPINSVEEGFNDEDDSCFWAIGDMLFTLEQFHLSKEQYKEIYGHYVPPEDPHTSAFLRKKERLAAQQFKDNSIPKARYLKYKESYENRVFRFRKFNTEKR
jgi:hypothetical protein